MPGVSTTGSSNIAVLDSKIVADLCSGVFSVDLTPSIYIGSGKENVLGANVQIKDPNGIIIKPYGSNYEIAPGLSGGMDAAITFNVPTMAGAYQYGTYSFSVQLFDGSLSWTVVKTVNICAPDKNKVTRKYGSLSARLDGDCKNGKLYVIVDGVPNYKGKQLESQVNDFTLEYPSSSGETDLETANGTFSTTLYEGVYKITGQICATYNFGDNVYVKIKYKVKREKNIRCLIDECCVFEKLKELHLKFDSDCTQEEKDYTSSVVMDALRLLRTAELAANCGEDASDYIDELEKLLGCSCTCNCAEGTPIIGTTPSGDVVVEGCNVEQSVNGLTTTYTINNYEYVVEIVENGGILVVSAPTLNSCVKTQVITFNISTAYSAIKTLADQNSTERQAWAAIINKTLDAIATGCLTSGQWTNKTLAERVQAILTKLCDCCGCEAQVSTTDGATVGNDVYIGWEIFMNGDTYSTDVYVDGVFVGSVLAPLSEIIVKGGADGLEHTYVLVPKCANGIIGTVATGTYQYLSCPDIAPAVVTDVLVEAVDCPYDLTSLEGAPPVGITYEWHNADSTTDGTIVADPTSVSTGIYYIFAKNTDGCYSIGTKVTLICDVAASCTAPQNLLVSKGGLGSFTITFQSAAYPPPGNSYTVKRRLSSDPDVPGSYTTIGTPVWNSGLNRWVIVDGTASSNVLYTYVAYSNCADSPETTPSVSYEYANLTCPALNLTAGTDTVDYSVTPPGGEVDQIEISIYDETGTVLIHTDTYTPAFADPLAGTFTYLESATTYKVKFTSYIGDVQSNCPFETITTS